MSNPVVVTTGDPAGCGPLITLCAVESIKNRKIRFIVIGDRGVYRRISGSGRILERVEFIDVGTKNISRLKVGRASKLSGRASLNYLDCALDIVSGDKNAVLVTSPVSKEAVQTVLSSFSGHTEYLAGFFKVPSVVMMMYSEKVKVALLTRHICLRKVSSSITAKELGATVRLARAFLKKECRIRAPRIAVAGINPHAGIDTFLDAEEKIIRKVVDSFRSGVRGPYPADTLFTRRRLKEFDCIIACYHDQGMIPFKLLSFDEGVNVTLGLPIIRTSPCHGVAFDRIREGLPVSAASMRQAILTACRFSYGN